MKKFTVFSVAAVMAAGVAGAQDDVVMINSVPASTDAQPEVTAEAALVSSYVWRGQVYNNDFVVQPQLTVAQYGVSFNVWGNWDLGRNYSGDNGAFSEIDFSLAYTLPIDVNDMAFDVGVINYNFPAEDGGGAPATTELFASATVLSFQDYVIPSVTIFGDIDEADGAYVLFDIVAPYQVSEYLSVEGGFSAGWGNTSYNDYYFKNAPTVAASTQDEGWNDFNFYGNASYELADNVTASLNLTYTALEGGSIEDAAAANYEAKEKFWGGVNIAYDF